MRNAPFVPVRRRGGGCWFARIASSFVHCHDPLGWRCETATDAAPRRLGPLYAVRLRSAVTVVGRYPALAGVDLDVADGEVVLLTGPNGAGKSTLLRLLAGLVPVTSGEATVFGHDLAHDRLAVRSQVALLSHSSFCYADLTVAENIRFHARVVGRDRRHADAVIERVGLTRSAGIQQRLLSAGQQRRLALALALVRDARLLLLDEPHAALDTTGREVLEAEIRSAADAGCTVVMASHEVERARPLADREVAMAGGRAAGGALAGDESAESREGSGGRVMAS